MKTLSHIIGIGGNISPPNPRLPSCIIPSLIRDDVDTILLVSSLDATEKSLDLENAKIARKNTEQKLAILQKFRNEFFSHAAPIEIEFHEWTNNYDTFNWLELWKEVEKGLSDDEKVAFGNMSKIHDETGAKIYAVRHAFWFFDIAREQHTGNLESIGGFQEIIFNRIREIISQIPTEILQGIFGESFIRNDVVRTTLNNTSRVVPYGEATRKVGKKRRSIEYILGYPQGDLFSHYQGPHQIKSGLHSDIVRIHEHISGERYQEFWEDTLHDFPSL